MRMNTPLMKLARVSLAAKPTAMPATPADASQLVRFTCHADISAYDATPTSTTLYTNWNRGRDWGWIQR